MKDERGNHTKAEEIAWKMFQKTGNISYYMLYKDVKRKK